MDILVYTEVDNRELDAACLIKCEMERRGYKVAIERYNRICESGNMFIYKPKVLILPWLYNSEFLYNFINSNNNGRLIVVNMQSEQILSENFIKNNYHMPKDICKQYLHLAWGKTTRERFLTNDIDEKNIWTIGNLNMDFNSPKFIKVYDTKEKLSNKYGLDSKKKWCLFISSFTHPSMSEEERSNYIKRFPFLKEFVDISVRSQQILSEWFEKFVVKHKEVEFIYRPHPVELNNMLLLDLAKKYDNFHVISQLSVRQWIHVCEKNMTWFSTSIADVYFQKKECIVLRPIKIPKEADCELFYDCDTVQEYESFENYILDNIVSEFPIKKERLSRYYGENHCGENYLKFCDALEDVIKKGHKTDKISIKCNMLSKMNRNVVSFLFHINKVFDVSKWICSSKKQFMKNQLYEKWCSRHGYKKYVLELGEKIKALL